MSCTQLHQRASAVSALLIIALGLLAPGAATSAEPNDTRAKVREQSQQALAKLYEIKPSARAVIKDSKGYATFSRWGLRIGVIGGGLGKGLAVAQPSGRETYMRFVEGSAGLGLGIKRFHLIFVFQSDAARERFISKGWVAGADATAAAKRNDRGKAIEGAAQVTTDVWVYQITEKGLAAEVSLKGTKYYADKSLN